MGWSFGGQKGPGVSHDRIFEAVIKCQESVNRCETSIAVIHESLTTGGDRFKNIEETARSNTQRINDLEKSINGSLAVNQFAKSWILPTALATLGTLALVISGLLWLGDRLDGDIQPQAAPDLPAKVMP